MSNIVVITGASSGFGALTARALADAGNTVYASMRKTTDRNAAAVQAAADYSTEHGVDLRAIEMDVNSPESVDAAVAGRGGARPHRRADPQRRPHGRRPGRGVHPEQLAELYNVNVLSTRRAGHLGLQQQRQGRHPAVPGAVLRRSTSDSPRTTGNAPMTRNWTATTSSSTCNSSPPTMLQRSREAQVRR
jgi:NAD(P)-dependent dehydrogenase (short-subunit alcohol dehydrogenase family)